MIGFLFFVWEGDILLKTKVTKAVMFVSKSALQCLVSSCFVIPLFINFPFSQTWSIFFVERSGRARVTGGCDEGASRARPDHRRRFVYIATTAILSTRRTDFCFDALVLGSVLIPASGHISSCKVCWKNRLCLSPKLRPGSHAES